MKAQRLIKPNKWLSIFVTLLFVMTMILRFIPSVSADEASVRQTITIKQAVEGNPEKTAYVYAVVQTNGPDMGTIITERSFRLSGNDTHKTYMTFTAPGTYEFTIGRLQNETKNASEIVLDDFYKDDNVVPVKHPFGYKVTQNEDGSLSVLPYTCYDNHVEFLKDGTGIVLSNTIKGPVEPTPTPTPSPSASVTPTPKPSSNSGSSDNGKGQYSPKTGDEFHMTLWVSIAVISILIIMLLLVLGRKKKKEEKS